MAEKLQVNKIGLFFGSFNPIHIGHLIIANFIVENTSLDQIWFVVSPLNPLKKAQDLLDNKIRLKLVSLAIEKNNKFIACDVEFKLPQPSYTINTLNLLTKKYQDKEFTLIIGEDNLECFEKWKDYQDILDKYSIYVYPRQNIFATKYLDHKNVTRIKAPQIEISSTQIRENIKTNKSICYLLPEKVREEIEKNNYYCNSK